MNRSCILAAAVTAALFSVASSAQAQLNCRACVGGANAGTLCTSNFDCPGGACLPSNTLCSFHGISNQAMGAATLAFDGMGVDGRARLAISNIGSSGNDGVRNVVPRPTKNMGVGLACPNMAGAIVGTQVEIQMCGDTGPGGSTELMSFLRLTGTGADEVTASVSMAGVGTTMYTLKGLNQDGQVVKMITGWNGQADFKSPRVDWEEVACSIDPLTGKLVIHYKLTNPVPVTFPDMLVANAVKEIWVMAENMGPDVPTTQTEFNNFFKNTGPVVITFESVAPVPTVSTWGVAMLTMLVVVAGTVVLRRRSAVAT